MTKQMNGVNKSVCGMWWSVILNHEMWFTPLLLPTTQYQGGLNFGGNRMGGVHGTG